jgi:hypothetical protein
MRRRDMRRVTQGLVLLLVLGLSVGLVSCGGDDDEDIAGTFVGSIFDNAAGQGTLTVILNQNGNNLVGNYTTVFGVIGGAALGNGSLTGVINGSTISLNAVPNQGPCTFVVNASVDGDDITGTYVANLPNLCSGGTFDISRQ